MSISITFRADEEKRDRIDRIAEGLDRDRSWIVNEALDQYLETYEKQMERIAKSQQAVKEGRVYSTKHARALLAKHMEKKRA